MPWQRERIAFQMNHATRSTSGFQGHWAQYEALSDDRLRDVFAAAQRRGDASAATSGLRGFAASLLTRGVIGIDDYVAVHGGLAAKSLTRTAEGRFVDMHTGADATELARIYSRAKHGSIADIRRLAGLVVSMLEDALADPDSAWRRLFVDAQRQGESIVMMTTGWRNVPSTANVLYAIVQEHLNMVLAGLGLPTLIDVKLPRIAPPCENYPSLSTEQRRHVSLTQDHVIPGPNFYRWSAIHVIFADDVLVTGSTADKVFEESMRDGARSVRSVYPIALDPRVALHDPAVEESLNTSEVSGAFDEVVTGFLGHRDNVPILRALRLVFSATNVHALSDGLHRLPPANVLALYVAALNNEFQHQVACAASLAMTRRHLVACGLLDARGLPHRPWRDEP